MQEDMHYYGTYAIARAAGLPIKMAQTIAYASQYVDDATTLDSEGHNDGGMFETTATAHTNSAAIVNAVADHTEQRKVWIPFHFFPGGQGKTLSDKLKCIKDSSIAREMTEDNLQHAINVKDDYGLSLMGITAHVYADTFSHYGFSGVSSRGNKVDGDSFELDVKDDKVKAYIMGKYTGFINKYTPRFILKNYRNIVSNTTSLITGALGHGPVGTYPDRPFLRWRFVFSQTKKSSGWRDNRATFLEACEKLHTLFSRFAIDTGVSQNAVEFESIKSKVKAILKLERDMQGRTDAWKEAIISGELFTVEDNEALHYSKDVWDNQAERFDDLNKSVEIITTDVYRFHQAAIYHRNYTLKHLLPQHGILVI